MSKRPRLNNKPSLILPDSPNEFIPIRPTTLRRNAPARPESAFNLINNSKKPAIIIPEGTNNSFYYPINPRGFGKNIRKLSAKQQAEENFMRQAEAFPIRRRKTRRSSRKRK